MAEVVNLTEDPEVLPLGYHYLGEKGYYHNDSPSIPVQKNSGKRTQKEKYEHYFLVKREGYTEASNSCKYYCLICCSCKEKKKDALVDGKVSFSNRIKHLRSQR